MSWGTKRGVQGRLIRKVLGGLLDHYDYPLAEPLGEGVIPALFDAYARAPDPECG